MPGLERLGHILCDCVAQNPAGLHNLIKEAFRWCKVSVGRCPTPEKDKARLRYRDRGHLRMRDNGISAEFIGEVLVLDLSHSVHDSCGLG